MRAYFDKKIILTLLCMPLIFVAAMVISQLIPNSFVKNNISTSQQTIATEGLYHDAYHTPQVHWLAGSDGHSDTIFLEQQLAKRDGGILKDSMMPNYARYWHGYSVFLRPLLVFFDLSHIRQLLVIAFTVLLGVLIHLIIKHLGVFMGICFGVAIALVNPPVIMISLQYSNMFLLMLSLSIVLILLMAKGSSLRTILLFFTVAGGLTSFFDLLTTPSITLGIPLILYIAFRIKNGDTKNILRDTAATGLLWGSGYLFVWLSKWLIGSALLNTNILNEAKDKVDFWSSDTTEIQSGGLSVLSVLSAWVQRLILIWPTVIMTLLCLVYTLFRKMNKKIAHGKISLQVVASLLIVTLLPIAWIVIARQHSFNHQWFSYRHLIVMIFGICTLLWYLSLQENEGLRKIISSLKARLLLLHNKYRKVFLNEK